jgi:hypothetical protein
MGWWRTFLDSLDSNGGHIFILMVLILGGFGVLQFEWANMKATEIISAAIGALLMMLKSQPSNREQTGGSTTLVATTNRVPTEPAPIEAHI